MAGRHRSDRPDPATTPRTDHSTEAAHHGRWQPWFTAAHQLRDTLHRLTHRR
ncbi:hypothetical protein [Kitasatospora sp. NPDC057223]|uniref:hypothetical protein n=1 Tax=Kitasatospora sp. NPDC057223 TaxID=3346055 RepID=UPI00363E54D3